MTTTGIHEWLQDDHVHASIDIETRGTTYGCIILEIGACTFNPLTGQASNHFHLAIDPDASTEAGFISEEDTVKWWSDRGGFPLDEFNRLYPPLEAIDRFNQWHLSMGITDTWARGKDFEQNLLLAYFHHANTTPPWKPWDFHCTRDIAKLAFPTRRWTNDVHRALPDAIIQAEQTALSLRKLLPLPDQPITNRATLPTNLDHLAPEVKEPELSLS